MKHLIYYSLPFQSVSYLSILFLNSSISRPRTCSMINEGLYFIPKVAYLNVITIRNVQLGQVRQDVAIKSMAHLSRIIVVTLVTEAISCRMWRTRTKMSFIFMARVFCKRKESDSANCRLVKWVY